VNEWLEQDPPPDLTKIPGSLADHISICQSCCKTVGFFRNFSQDKNLAGLSLRETGEFMKSFQNKALANSKTSDSRALPKASIFAWLDMKWSLALAMVVLLLVIGFSLFFKQTSVSVTEEVLSFAVLKGKATILSTDGKGAIVASNAEQVLVQEAGIKFDSDSEPVEIQYKNGGKVFLTGLGQMKVLKDGINVETGKFNAKFKNLGGVLKVRVPCAVLAIRGTEIQFDIHPPTAEILLVEGAADLIPENTLLKTIRLERGKRVILANNTWALPKSELQNIPKNEPPVSIASDSQPQSKPASVTDLLNAPEQGYEEDPAASEDPASSEEDIDTDSTTIGGDGEERSPIGSEDFGDN